MQYQCGSCGFFKLPSQLESHLAVEHHVHVRITKWKCEGGRHIGNYCEPCHKQFRSKISLFHHIDIVHHIHISYVRGMSKKHVFLDGI